MKKFISLALALVFVLSMATVAFAAEDAATGNPKLQKTYTLEGEGAVTPDVTFSFTATLDGYKSDIGDTLVTSGYPNIVGNVSLANVSFSSSDFTGGKTSVTKDVTVNLPTYSNVGYYYYTLTESAVDSVTGKPIAGVTYASGQLKMVVSVLRDTTQETETFVPTYYVYVLNENNQKTSSLFNNTYGAGKLTVKKMVAGSLGDKTAKYPVTVTLTSENPVLSTIKVGGVEKSLTWTDNGGKYSADITLDLSHNTPVTIENIPAGTSYNVVETGATEANGTITYGDGYTVTYASNTGAIGTTTANATITNTKNGQIDTGITLDTLPFVLILAVCTGAVVLFVIKRRRSVDF